MVKGLEAQAQHICLRLSLSGILDWKNGRQTGAAQNRPPCGIVVFFVLFFLGGGGGVEVLVFVQDIHYRLVLCVKPQPSQRVLLLVGAVHLGHVLRQLLVLADPEFV